MLSFPWLPLFTVCLIYCQTQTESGSPEKLTEVYQSLDLLLEMTQRPYYIDDITQFASHESEYDSQCAPTPEYFRSPFLSGVLENEADYASRSSPQPLEFLHLSEQERERCITKTYSSVSTTVSSGEWQSTTGRYQRHGERCRFGPQCLLAAVLHQFLLWKNVRHRSARADDTVIVVSVNDRPAQSD